LPAGQSHLKFCLNRKIALVKTHAETGSVSGHGFSRAAQANKKSGL
jgi:hypothetical protein